MLRCVSANLEEKPLTVNEAVRLLAKTNQFDLVASFAKQFGAEVLVHAARSLHQAQAKEFIAAAE